VEPGGPARRRLSVYLTVGLIIAAKRPSNPLGWLLLLVGLILGLNELLHYYADYTLSYRPGSLPGGLAVAWVSTWIWALIFPILPFVFLLFPNGRLPSRRSDTAAADQREAVRMDERSTNVG
jgi:two-component system, NarL family, sensor kinase